MTETVTFPFKRPRRFHFELAPSALLQPRRAFKTITAQAGSMWLTPLLILTLTAVIQVLVAGSLKQQAALAGGLPLPPDFQYYSPEMQAQFQQAMSATQSPVFIYVFPALLAVSGVWIGWLVVGGLLHLALTLLGGRGATGSVMNIVAWASLPFAVRDIIRAAAMLSTHQLITKPGLSGFAPVADDRLSLYLAALLALVDLYLIWHIALVIVGVRSADGLSTRKIAGAVLSVVLFVVLVQALLAFLASRLGSLTVIRPFF